LALKAHGLEGVDLPFALDQIAGRQTARRKLPSWAAVDSVVYPPHISMEQCSSEQTAQYKKSVLDRLIPNSSFLIPNSSLYIDLTGGFGVDFSFLSRGFRKAVYVERQEHLCDVASHNFRCLGIDNAEVVCEDAEEYLDYCEKADVIYLDPARRDSHGGKTFAISDCTPDVISLLPMLLKKATLVMIKLSPMLDWRKAVADLGEENVVEVHIVSVDNDCKELIVVLSSHVISSPSCPDSFPSLYCANISAGALSSIVVPLSRQSLSGKRQFAVSYNPEIAAIPAFLYEPNASIMKAGCFDALCDRYPNLMKIAPNSHLFISSEEIHDFPGRSFSIEKTTTMNKKELRQALSGIASANIATRNFPLSVQELRKRLKLKDGGNTYIFATTDINSCHILYICTKLSNNT
ncbi:MAG: RsmD family RNA methyltransferase, partial [Prevotella sp.]